MRAARVDPFARHYSPTWAYTRREQGNYIISDIYYRGLYMYRWVLEEKGRDYEHCSEKLRGYDRGYTG